MPITITVSVFYIASELSIFTSYKESKAGIACLSYDARASNLYPFKHCHS